MIPLLQNSGSRSTLEVKTTGIAMVNDQSGEVVFAAELTHRGQQINQTWMIVEVCVVGDEQDRHAIESQGGKTDDNKKGLVTPIAREPNKQCHHLGESASKSLPYH